MPNREFVRVLRLLLREKAKEDRAVTKLQSNFRALKGRRATQATRQHVAATKVTSERRADLRSAHPLGPGSCCHSGCGAATRGRTLWIAAKVGEDDSVWASDTPPNPM